MYGRGCPRQMTFQLAQMNVVPVLVYITFDIKLGAVHATYH